MNILKKFLGALLFAGVATSASAIVVNDVKNPSVFLNEGKSYTVIHDLTDNGVPTDNYVTDASLRLGFSDGTFFGDWQKDLAGISGDGISGQFEVDGTHFFGYDIRWLNVGTNGIDSLNLNGLLEVTVTALSTRGWGQHNDFWWKTSKLVANIEANPVSEPATLALFGLGLAGLGLARRKQKNT